MLYSEISAKMLPYITNNAKLQLRDVCVNTLTAIGCDRNAYKFGNTQVFFRPKNEQFIHIFRHMDSEMCEKIGQEISKKFKYRQRLAFWILFRFVGGSKLN